MEGKEEAREGLAIQNIYDNKEFFEGYKNEVCNKWNPCNDGIERPRLMSPITLNFDSDVADLGCGSGYWTFKLVNAVRSITAVDVSTSMLELAKKRVTEEVSLTNEVQQGVTFINEPLETVNFPHQSFDLVLSCLALHYIEDINSIFHRIFAWLKPGGYFIFSVEHPIVTSACGIHPRKIEAEEETQPNNAAELGDNNPVPNQKRKEYSIIQWTNTRWKAFEKHFGMSTMCKHITEL
jgi:ubiquinone/menaquinone biosynthesis C-methylase UbiE